MKSSFSLLRVVTSYNAHWITTLFQTCVCALLFYHISLIIYTYFTSFCLRIPASRRSDRSNPRAPVLGSLRNVININMSKLFIQPVFFGEFSFLFCFTPKYDELVTFLWWLFQIFLVFSLIYMNRYHQEKWKNVKDKGKTYNSLNEVRNPNENRKRGKWKEC